MAGFKFSPHVFKSNKEKLEHDDEIQHEMNEIRNHIRHITKPLLEITPEEEKAAYQAFSKSEVDSLKDAGLSGRSVWSDVR